MNTDFAYIAGLIDGEGYLGIIPHGQYFVPQVAIYMTDRAVLHWAFTRFGGSFEGPLKVKGNREQTYRWKLQARPAIFSFLQNVLPYLRVKKAHAKVLIGFCEKFVDGRRKTRTTEQQAEMERYRMVLKALNSKGPGSSELKAQLAAVI